MTQAMTNIETTEGWERRGPFLFRQYGESFATIRSDGDGDWVANVSHEQDTEQGWERECADAVAWANEQLGVPKPVEVVEREFADGWLLWSDETKRCARVSPVSDDWSVDIDGGYVHTALDKALNKARAYVRGDA